MASVDTQYEHVSIDEHGVPFISGTTMKVVELIVEKMAYGWSPEEIHFQHPYLNIRADLFRACILQRPRRGT